MTTWRMSRWNPGYWYRWLVARSLFRSDALTRQAWMTGRSEMNCLMDNLMEERRRGS